MKLNDKIVIQTKSVLSYEEIKSLSLLYLPLVGSEGVSMYFAMFSLCSPATLISQELAITFVKSILDTTVKDLKQILDKLSAAGLISLYEKQLDDNSLYLVSLHKPLDAEAFKDSLLLRNSIVAKLNLKNTQIVFDNFKINHLSLTNFTNKSKDFSEVFNYQVPVEFNSKSVFRGKKQSKLPNISSYFDYELFLSLIMEELVNENTNLITNEDYIESVKMTAFTYELTESDMARVYELAYEHNNNPLIEDIIYYAKKYKSDDTSKQSIQNQDNDLEIDEKIFEKTPIAVLLKVYANTKKLEVTPLDLEHANLFYLNHKETNKTFLAITVLQTFQQKHLVPVPNYLEAVLTSLLAKYHKPQELIDYFLLKDKTKINNNQSYKINSKKDKVKRHDWIDDIIDSLDKNEEE